MQSCIVWLDNLEPNLGTRLSRTRMEGHSGEKCNWIVTSTPLDRTACYSFVSCMPFDRTRLSVVLPIRSYSPFDRTEHSVVLPIRPCVSFGQRFNKKTAASSMGYTQKSTLGYVPLKFQPLETWTHETCVLGCCDEDKTPDREQTECLLMAGLGKAKLFSQTRKQRTLILYILIVSYLHQFLHILF